MRQFLTIFGFLLLSALLAQEFSMPLDNAKWSSKDNTTVVAEAPECICVTIDPAQHGFGWITRGLPADTANYAGIYGRFRTNARRGRLEASLLLPGASTTEYYTQRVGTFSDSTGGWVDFYLSWDGFQPAQNARSAFSPRRLNDKARLQFTFVDLAAEEPTTIWLDQLALVPQANASAIALRIEQRSLERLLLSTPRPDAMPHPRLLLNAETLPRLRAKAHAGGDAQLVYEKLLASAEQYLVSYDAPNAAKPLLEFAGDTKLPAHRQRGAFEGILTKQVRPIEVLAAVGLITGDERFSRHAAQALVALARALPASSPALNQGFYYTRTFLVRALAFGYDWCHAFLTPEEQRVIQQCLLSHILEIYRESRKDNCAWGGHPLNRVWNWCPGLVGCAGVAMLALEGETATAENALLFHFRRYLKDYLTLGIDQDGAGHEGPAYLSYGIGAGLEFAECLRQQDRGDLFCETNWQLAPLWLAAEMLPNRPLWNNLSDCNHATPVGCPVYDYVCGRLAELARTDPLRPGESLPAPPDRFSAAGYLAHFPETAGERTLSYGALAQVMGWVWEKGRAAVDLGTLQPHELLAHLLFFEECPVTVAPEAILPSGMLFRGRGLAVSRDGGFDHDALHLAVEAGPHAAGHDQADKGSFTFRAYGQDFFIDSGYGNDGDSRKSGSSFAHNLVLVDGEGQPISWHNNSNGEITGYHHDTFIDWIRVDARDAWNLDFSQQRPVPTGRNLAAAERHFLFVRADGDLPPYLVVYDHIQKADDALHDFTWQWHFPGYLEVDTSNPSAWLAHPPTATLSILTSLARQTGGKAHFEFVASADGEYVFCGLTAAGGPDPGRSDSFAVTIGNDHIAIWDTNSSASPSWTPVKHRNDAQPRRYPLKAGEHIAVTLHAREPQTQLFRLAMVPAETALPLSLDGKVDGGQVLTAEDATLGTPPLERVPWNNNGSSACLAVYPVTSPNAKTKLTTFETTSHETHGLLLHTAERLHDPHFLMVLVPLKNAEDTRPGVEKMPDANGHGVLLRWPDGAIDQIQFLPTDLPAGSGTDYYPKFQRNDRTWQGK